MPSSEKTTSQQLDLIEIPSYDISSRPYLVSYNIPTEEPNIITQYNPSAEPTPYPSESSRNKLKY